jgi:CheY-like chemotaxis protein
VKVLVVDPDVRRAPVLKDTLLAGGVEVTVASSGSFALTMLEWNRHDVVVCRARIDDMEGHELCAILKSDPGTRDVRFVLVAAAEEVTAANTAAAGVDLVLPSSMTGGAILPLIVQLMRADRVPEDDADRPRPPAEAPTAGAPRPATETEPDAEYAAEAPAVPRIRPEPLPPSMAEPPKRYATTAVADTEEPWATDETPPAATSARPSIAPGAPSKTSRATPSPVRGPVPSLRPTPTTPAKGPLASPSRPSTSPRTPAPTPPRAPAPSASRPVAARGAAPPTVEDLLAMPKGTFQGSLEVMELADLTQAIAGGGKSGRLILALPQGGGLMLFEKGRVVHAEYRNTVGEEAFGALLAASHADGAGRFCFLPLPSGEASSLPRTIDKRVDQLLLSSATAIDEKG